MIPVTLRIAANVTVTYRDLLRKYCREYDQPDLGLEKDLLYATVHQVDAKLLAMISGWSASSIGEGSATITVSATIADIPKFCAEVERIAKDLWGEVKADFVEDHLYEAFFASNAAPSPDLIGLNFDGYKRLSETPIPSPQGTDMPRTREENAADLAREEAERHVRIPLYILVTGTPSSNDDQAVPGAYLVKVDPDLTDEERAEAALDVFHENNGISELDDFDIRVVDPDCRLLPRMENHENGSLWNRAEYIDYVSDGADLPPAVQASLQQGAISEPEMDNTASPSP